MRALRAVEQVFVLVLLGFGVRGVSVRVGDFGRTAVFGGVDAVPGRDEGGEGGDAEDVAGCGKGVLVRDLNICWRWGCRWEGGGEVDGPVFLGDG